VTPSQLDHQKRNSHCQADPDDPYNLDARFVSNQLLQFDDALAEIRAGCKQTCWLWFVLPTAPYLDARGNEVGSSMNQHFALRGDDCVEAYLQFERKGINLRQNYLTILKAVQEQLEDGVTMLRLFGPMDVTKAQSSFQLFRRIAHAMHDAELEMQCQNVLNLVEVDQKRRDAIGNRSIFRSSPKNPKQQQHYRHVMTL